MKAVVYHQYGQPDVLRLDDVPRPVPSDDQVLVRVHATSINSWDWDLLTGTFQGRMGGFRKPQYSILGADIAGRVEEVGNRCTRYKVGDEVFGDISGSGWGGLAEYVSVAESVLAPKSPKATFEQSAALPQAGVLALQGLRRGQMQSGQSVLINGAGGGVGTFAVQLAKSAGAEVTAVDRPEKLKPLHSIGADNLVDFHREDFTRMGQRFDLVLDVTLSRSVTSQFRALSSEGRYVVVGGTTGLLLQTVTLGSLVGLMSSKKTGIVAHKPNSDDLGHLADLVDCAQLRPVIDSTYSLEDGVAAFRRFGSGLHVGKVVITV